MKNRRTLRVLATIAGLPVAAWLIAGGIDRAAIENGADPLAAEATWRHDPEVLRVLAERRLAAGDNAGAAALARRALAVAPLDHAALRTLAFAEEGAGKSDQALDLLGAATELSWRDPTAQLWRFQIMKAVGNLSDAARRADAVARADGFQDEGFGAMRQLMALPGGVQAVATQLGTVPIPYYREQFFDELLPRDTAETDATAQLVAELNRSGAPLSRQTVALVLQHMVNGGYGATAWNLWQGLGHRLPAGHSLIDDPDLSLTPATLTGEEQHGPFEWNSSGSVAQLDEITEPNGRAALAIAAPGDGAPWFAKRYLAADQPGYRLSFATRGTQAMIDRLRPQVQCTNPGIPVQVSSEQRVPRPDGDQLHTLTIRPARGCGLLLIGFSIAPGNSGSDDTLDLRDVRLGIPS